MYVYYIYDDDDYVCVWKTFCVTIVSGSWGKSGGSDHIGGIFINGLFQLL